MNWLMRLINCEACSGLLFCSSGPSNQYLRSACRGQLPWGHQNPFKWAISLWSPSCQLMVVPQPCHAPCTVSRISLASLLCVRHVPLPPTEHRMYPLSQNPPPRQLAPSNSICSLSLLWTLIYSHSFPQLPQRQYPPHPHVYQLLQSNELPTLSAYQKCPSVARHVFIIFS